MPYQCVRKFEETIATWAGAPYAVAVESGSAAIFLCCQLLIPYWSESTPVRIPKHTYPSVPCSIIHAGGTVEWGDSWWEGVYELEPYTIVDSALRFKRSMYEAGTLWCLSFHAKKHLSIGRGGMILTDEAMTAKWLRRARYDGRDEKPLPEASITMIGWNMYMQPEQAARGLLLFEFIKSKDLPDLDPRVQGYPDLSKFEIYNKGGFDRHSLDFHHKNVHGDSK